MKPTLTAAQAAQRERQRRANEIVRNAAQPPTLEQLRQAEAERDAARAATADLAEIHQRVLAELDRLRDQKLCPVCSQVAEPEHRRKKVSA